MSKPPPSLPSLADLRQEIDTIDAQVHSLLMQRGDIIDRLNTEIGKILTMPDVKDTLVKQGIDVAGGTPEQFGAYMQAEFPKWKELVIDSGATIQD